MELIQGLGLAHGGSQIQASLLQCSFSAKGFYRSLQQGHCYPTCSVTGVRSIRQTILGSRQSGFRCTHSRKVSVRCSESSIAETVSQAGIEVVESLEEAENQSLRAVSRAEGEPETFDTISQAGIEVVESLEEAENQSLRAVSRAAGEPETFAEEDELVSPVQAALEEILAEEDTAENAQFHSMEYEAVMVAASQVADALSEEEVNIMSFPLLEPMSPMGAAVVTLWPESLEVIEEAVEEEPEVGFMIQTEEPEQFAPPPEASILLEEPLDTVEEEETEEGTEEETLLDLGAVASALMVKEVADALKAPDEGTVSHMLEKETEVERRQGAEEKSMIEQLKDIFVFAGPALGIWLSGPIMGIIDTAVIGQSSSLELAALGPGTVLCDSVCYIFMFLSVATSNLVATSLAHKNKEEAAHYLSRMLFLALAFGLGLLLVTEIWVTELLQAFVGVQNYDLIPAAKIYVQIRALAWPAVLVSLVSQSASLAMMDSRNPLKVLVIGSVFNLVGDVALCSFLGYGIAGAAWATIVAQYVAGILMALSLNDKGYSCFNIQIPSFRDLAEIAKLSGPLILTMISKVSFYTLITYLATSLGAITVAAHQVMIGIYGLCSVWGEPLAQTAQSFMPPLLYGSQRNLTQARKLLKQLLYIGLVVGTLVGALAIVVPWLCPGVFTSDAAIISQMQAISIPFLVGMISCPPSLSLEGTLLAGRDFGFLSFSMTACFVGGTALLLACKVHNWGLAGSWWTLAAFQWARFLLAFARLHSPSSCLADTVIDTTLRPKTA